MTKTITLEEVAPAVVKETIEAGEDVTITSEGKPFARVVRVPRTPPSSLEGSVIFLGDIVEPLDEEWEADR